MEYSKEDALKVIREAQAVESVAYDSDAIDPLIHLQACNILQYIELQIKRSPLAKFEGDD